MENQKCSKAATSFSFFLTSSLPKVTPYKKSPYVSYVTVWSQLHKVSAAAWQVELFFANAIEVKSANLPAAAPNRPNLRPTLRRHAS
jgi:hypothetical protein